MAYLLKIDCSPMGENSNSRKIGDTFVEAFKAANVDVEVKVRDLAADPVPHLDGEALTAGFLPEESRTDGMKTKHQFRLDLIKEITEAKEILVTVQMWNWNVPSNLKAYIDQIIMPGTFDAYTEKKLAGKKVTVAIAAGGHYSEGSHHPEWNFEGPYLTHIFTSLGSTDVKVIMAEYCLAGVVPGMEELIPKKEESMAAAKAAATERAGKTA